MDARSALPVMGVGATMLLVCVKDDLVLDGRPPVFAQSGVQVVDVPLAALLRVPGKRKEVERDQYPNIRTQRHNPTC